MPNKLSIRIETVDVGDPPVKQTISKFVIEPGDHVWFHNNASTDAKVEFEGPSPLCQGNNPPPVTLIPVGAGKKEMRTVCVEGGQFKYKATVDGALPEDPILIVERARIEVNPIGPVVEKKPIVFPEDWAALLAGLALGLVIGYLGGRWRQSRPT